MSTDLVLYFNIIMMISIIAGSGALAWTLHHQYRGYLKLLDEDASPAVAKKAINRMTINAMMSFPFGMVLGDGVASMGGAHQWTAAVAVVCVAAFSVAVVVRLMRAPEVLDTE